MMLARAPAAVAQKRSPVCPGSSVTLPILRPSLVCRFKEDDKVEQAKQKVQDTTSDLQSKLQQAAQRTGEGMDPDALKVNPAIPAFTRRREVFSGRLAMFGFVAACFWEYLFPSHPNVLQQISNGTAGVISPTVALVGILGLIAYNAISAAGPGSPSYSEENKRDADKRAPNLPAAEKASDIGKLFGGSGWGFTKANEVLHGRIGMLGFMGVVFQQLSIGGLTGPGPIAQLAYVLNQPATDGFYNSVATFAIGFSVFAIALAYLTGNPGSMEEKDVY